MKILLTSAMNGIIAEYYEKALLSSHTLWEDTGHEASA